MCLEKVFSYDSGFNKSCIGGADILITARSFTDILTNTIVFRKYASNLWLPGSDKISLLLFWLFN